MLLIGLDQKLVLAVCDIRFSGIGFWLQGTSRWLKERAKPRSSISERKKDYVFLFSKLRTSIKIHDNHSDTGQHLQFMRCFKSVTVWKGMFSVDNVVRDPLTIFELLTPVQRGFATMGRIWLMTRRNLGRSASLLLFFPITFSNLALLLVCLI